MFVTVVFDKFSCLSPSNYASLTLYNLHNFKQPWAIRPKAFSAESLLPEPPAASAQYMGVWDYLTADFAYVHGFTSFSICFASQYTFASHSRQSPVMLCVLFSQPAILHLMFSPPVFKSLPRCGTKKPHPLGAP